MRGWCNYACYVAAVGGPHGVDSAATEGKGTKIIEHLRQKEAAELRNSQGGSSLEEGHRRSIGKRLSKGDGMLCETEIYGEISRGWLSPRIPGLYESQKSRDMQRTNKCRQAKLKQKISRAMILQTLPRTRARCSNNKILGNGGNASL